MIQIGISDAAQVQNLLNLIAYHQGSIMVATQNGEWTIGVEWDTATWNSGFPQAEAYVVGADFHETLAKVMQEVPTAEQVEER